MKRALSVAAAAVAAWVAFAEAPAWAQAAPQIEMRVSAETIDVGGTVQLEMEVSSGDALPRSPELGGAPNFVVRGANSSPSQTHFNINGNQMDRYTLTVDWVLQSQRVGTFTIGPPTVVVGAKRYSASVVKIHVVPQGQAPSRIARPSPQNPFGGFSPFDPWRQLFPGFDPNDREPPPQPQAMQVSTDPKLALEAARGDVYFLHAAIDKSRAVVGEQVTLSVYEYIDTESSSGEADGDDVHETAAPDFAKHPLLPDNQEAPLAGYASIAGHIWQVRLARRWALFPLRAGDLSILPMSLTIVKPRKLAGQLRTTETLHVHVTEPTMAGRPPGYALGDVGRFALSAQVQPRDIEQGGAVGIHVELSGTGNLPGTLSPPARDGVEWLSPEVHDSVGPIGNEAYGGKRSFEFVVRVKRAGDVDLGDLTLPFWDPEKKSYAVARATLGHLHVTGTPGMAANEPAKASEVLAGLPAARTKLAGLPAAGRHIDDSPLFWLVGILGSPLALGIVVVGRNSGERIARMRRDRKASPEAELRERVTRARATSTGADPRALDSAIGHALEAATRAHAGVNVRGAVGPELVARLERAGVAPSAATNIADLLRECEAARFAPDAAELEAARNRWTRAETAIRALERQG